MNMKLRWIGLVTWGVQREQGGLPTSASSIHQTSSPAGTPVCLSPHWPDPRPPVPAQRAALQFVMHTAGESLGKGGYA